MNHLRSNIRYNIVKHHAGAYREILSHWNDARLEHAIEEIQTLGSNQIDIYTGHLSPGQVMDETSR
jgi:hypothetical protein